MNTVTAAAPQDLLLHSSSQRVSYGESSYLHQDADLFCFEQVANGIGNTLTLSGTQGNRKCQT